MKPFFCYYGGKWRAAGTYPKPKYPIIIEPFAGAAGYSLYWDAKYALLVDKDPKIFAVWDFLFSASAADIEALPLPDSGYDLTNLPPGPRHLLGFWYNGGSARGRRYVPSRVRNGYGWSASIRARISRQIGGLAHWKVANSDFDKIPNVEATWFIDPPYRGRAGSNYTCSSKNIDYARLADFCTSRRGQVIVCEAIGADWLPFRVHGTIQANTTSHSKSEEAIWTNA